MAVKRRPVVGVFVNGEPGAEVAAKWIVSRVSPTAQLGPETSLPPIHFTMMEGVPISTVPVRSIPAGWRIA